MIGQALQTQFGISIEQASQAHIDGVVTGLRDSQPAVIARVVSEDKSTASVTFRAQNLSLKETYNLLQSVIRDSRENTGHPFVKVGFTALGAELVDSIIRPRLLLNIFCIAVVMLILLLIYRKLVKTVFIILPVGLVIGLISLIMYVTDIGINPVTAILGILVVGINTEFMVLLVSRYEEEKANGLSFNEAMVVAVSKMGRAIVATGITTLGGFGVLIASSFPMMRDFGIVTVSGVALCMISTILIMPPLLVWWDNMVARRRAKNEAASEDLPALQ